MTAADVIQSAQTGGGFLLGDGAAEDIFTPEDLDEEHRAIARTADEFYSKEIAPQTQAIQQQEPGVAVGLLKKSAGLGLLGISIPEEFGGMELDLASSLLAAEHLGRDGSYAAWHGAHTGIGTLPILYFGTNAQKRKYLPKLASGEMIAAYALTEPHAGSDALSLRTRADLSPDGKHYVLNGQKMWITNGGAADLFTVFAKVNGTDVTAFLVERRFGGVTSGAEEKKMGIKGSSTTAIFFENVPVPVENMLGEIGRGHVIAFNILNMGRLSLGALAAGGAKDVLATSLRYAKERKAFGTPIASFGAIQGKLAEMAIRIYAAESVIWRVVGMIQNRLNGSSSGIPASQTMLQTLEEFAAECSLVKISGSETLDYVADEGVQIHGGYGFHQDYSVERAYRDSRINRIFEGTNEINRLVLVGMLLKRAARGQLALLPAVEAVTKDSGETIAPGDANELLVRHARRIALQSLALAQQAFKAELEKQQEIVMRLADILVDVFAMQSAWMRMTKLQKSNRAKIASVICEVFLRDAMSRIEWNARNVIGACASGDTLTTHVSMLQKLAQYDPVNSVERRRSVASHVLAAGRYAI